MLADDFFGRHFLFLFFSFLFVFGLKYSLIIDRK